eukprot:9664912-Lingulodinium_polyedra.AAC.1
MVRELGWARSYRECRSAVYRAKVDGRYQFSMVRHRGTSHLYVREAQEGDDPQALPMPVPGIAVPVGTTVVQL